jgi:outer membrane protein TolC
VCLLALASSAAGCVLAPRAAVEERQRLRLAGEAFELSTEERDLPELPAEAGWRDLLRRAFLANGDLESAYFEWKAALTRVDIAAAYPNTNVSLGFSYLFSDQSMKAWDRTTLNAGFDPMQNLSFPTKVIAAGRVALDQARAAAERFRAAKFDLQRQLLTAFADYALLAEKRRIQEATLALDRLAAETAAERVRAGARQKDLLDAEIRLRLSENSLRALDAELIAQRAMLNALVARAPEAALAPPAAFPEPRPLPASDEELLAAAVAANPELNALQREVDAQRGGVALARQQYIPDFNPFAGFTGGISQVVGVAVSLPATIPRLRAGVAEARAMLRAGEARAAQAGLDRAARWRAALAALRDGERQEALFRGEILPAVELLAANAEQAYATGAASIDDVIETRRLALDTRLLAAEAGTVRERQLAALEALAGIDVETLGAPAPPDSAAGGASSDARRSGRKRT